MTQPKCVLRTQSLCDGHLVLDYRGRPSQRVGCYCTQIDGLVDEVQVQLRRQAQTDRARTVARSVELERIAERHDRHTGAATDAPPY